MPFKIDLSPKIPEIPKFKDKRLVDITYPLIPPYAYARIKFVPEEMDLVYFVLEPKLNETEKEALELIEEGLKEVLTVGFSQFKDINKALEYLEENVRFVCNELGIDLPEDSFNKIMYYVFRDFIGLNEIEPLMHDPYVEDIECDGVNIPVYVVHRHFGNLKTNIVFTDEEKLKALIEKMAQRAGRYISYAEPILDATLPDGSRVNATYTSDITTRGPSFTIRKFRKEPWTVVDLILNNTMDINIAAYLWWAVEHRANILICGETASGKTTLLNAIALFIPKEAKIISIEDTREIQLYHENWIPTVTREGFGPPTEEGKRYGEVTMFDLLKEAFRQNPDYIIVGEVRGKEAYVMFQGMASGHACLSTMHAGSVDAVIRRLVTPPINLPESLIELLDVVVILTHLREKRIVKEIEEIVSVERGQAKTNKVFIYDALTNTFKFSGYSYVFYKISKEYGVPVEELWKEWDLRRKLLWRLVTLGVRDYKTFGKIITAYYLNKEYVLSFYKII